MSSPPPTIHMTMTPKIENFMKFWNINSPTVACILQTFNEIISICWQFAVPLKNKFAGFIWG